MMSVSEFVCHFITIIMMQLIFVYNFGNMAEIKASKNKKYYITILITSILVFSNNFYNLLLLRLLTGLIINCITGYYIYETKLTSTIFYCIIHTFISMIVELLLSLLLMFNFENVTIFNSLVYAKMLFSLIMGIITIIIFKNNTVKYFIKKIKKIILDKNNFIILIILVLLFMNMIGVARAVKTNDIFLIIISVICVVFMLLTIKIIINDKYNISLLNEQTKNMKDNIKAYSNTIDDCRELKHNLRNDLLILKSGVNNEAQDKINEIIIKYNTNYEWINMIDEIPEGLQGLIYLKQKESEKHKIKLYINTIKNFKTNNKDYIDLCSILGVLIDNAIEASKNSKSRIIEVNFKEVNKNLNIKISNKYINDIDLNKIGNKNYSTKEYKSGLGLNFIKNINNSKIKVSFKIVNNLFITDILYFIKN